MRAVSTSVSCGGRLEVVSAAAIRAVKKYCRQDGITKEQFAPTVRWLKTMDMRSTDEVDWFLVCDALGTSCQEVTANSDVASFYKLALLTWWLESLQAARDGE